MIEWRLRFVDKLRSCVVSVLLLIKVRKNCTFKSQRALVTWVFLFVFEVLNTGHKLTILTHFAWLAVEQAKNTLLPFKCSLSVVLLFYSGVWKWMIWDCSCPDKCNCRRFNEGKLIKSFWLYWHLKSWVIERPLINSLLIISDVLFIFKGLMLYILLKVNRFFIWWGFFWH